MESAIEFLQPIATKEALTALGLLTALFIGWKAAQKGASVIGGFAGKASYAGLAATVLALLGTAGMGTGIGEIASRWEESPDAPQLIVPGVQNDELHELVTTFNGHSNPELFDKTLDYATRRDGLSRRLNDDMLEKLLDKTNEGNAQVVQSIIELYKSREERDGNRDSLEIAEPLKTADLQTIGGPMLFTSYSEYGPVEATEVSTITPLGNEDSVVSLQTACALILAGLASCIGSVYTLRRRSAVEKQTA